MKKPTDDYEVIKADQLPLNEAGALTSDLFIYMPTLNRYIRYVPAGDVVEAHKLEALKKHAVPELFIRKSYVPLPSDVPPGFDVLSKEQSSEIRRLAKSFMAAGAYPADSAFGEEQYQRILAQSDQFLAVITPDLKTIRRHLMKTTKYLHLMADAAAISTLATLFAIANDFKSQKSFRELSVATLIMDAALSEFSEDDLKTFLLSPESLSPETHAAIQQHPLVSYNIAREKMANVSETTLQLVLCHHELFNGKGYPRGIRYESLIPLTKILSLAVDVNEFMKVRALRKEPFSLEGTLAYLRDESGEAHLRRHNRQMIENVVRFTDQEYSGDDDDEIGS